MADTHIQVHAAMGALLPSVNQVEIVAGNTLTFTSANDDCALHFSPDLLGILSPNQDAVALLSSGQQLRYSFTHAAPGVHEVILQDPSSPAPQGFTASAAAGQNHVLVRAGGSIPADATAEQPVELKASFEEVKFETTAVHGIISNPIQT